ncbi:MAG: hypothetical protein LBB11_03390 [Puniceicoccales bacterium]|nr:hypothetical protein [Puniceicoccales bacterium]
MTLCSFMPIIGAHSVQASHISPSENTSKCAAIDPTSPIAWISNDEKKTKAKGMPEQAAELQSSNMNLKGKALRDNFIETVDGYNDTLSLKSQHFETMIVDKISASGAFTSETISGRDCYSAIYGRYGANGRLEAQPCVPFASGYVDEPKKALEWACELTFVLHSLHEHQKVYCNLKLENIIIERWKHFAEHDPDKIAVRNLRTAVAVGSQLPPQLSLNGAPEYFSPNSEDEKVSEATTSYDIYTLGTVLPSLFFGGGAKNMDVNFFSDTSSKISPFIQKYRELERAEYTAETKMKQELQEKDYQHTHLCDERETVGWKLLELDNFDNILDEEASSHKNIPDPQASLLLKENLREAMASVEQKIASLTAEIDTLRKALNQFKENTKKIAQAKIKALMNQDLWLQFEEMNVAMKKTTGKYYPEPILRKLAQITADCLSLDPLSRPSAKIVLETLTGLVVSSDWEIKESPEKIKVDKR